MFVLKGRTNFLSPPPSVLRGRSRSGSAGELRRLYRGVAGAEQRLQRRRLATLDAETMRLRIGEALAVLSRDGALVERGNAPSSANSSLRRDPGRDELTSGLPNAAKTPVESPAKMANLPNAKDAGGRVPAAPVDGRVLAFALALGVALGYAFGLANAVARRH